MRNAPVITRRIEKYLIELNQHKKIKEKPTTRPTTPQPTTPQHTNPQNDIKPPPQPKDNEDKPTTTRPISTNILPKIPGQHIQKHHKASVLAKISKLKNYHAETKPSTNTNKTWSSVSNSSLSKTFALASLESLNIVLTEAHFGSEKILGLKKNGSKNYFGLEKNFGPEKI